MIIVKKPPVTPRYATQPIEIQLKKPLLSVCFPLYEFSAEEPIAALGIFFLSSDIILYNPIV